MPSVKTAVPAMLPFVRPTRCSRSVRSPTSAPRVVRPPNSHRPPKRKGASRKSLCRCSRGTREWSISTINRCRRSTPASRSWRGLPCQASIIQLAPGWAASRACCTARAALRHRNVAGLAAFLEDLHVINAAVAEELALMPIEGGRQPREHRIARVEPARPREAGPLSLRHDVCVGKAPLEISGHYAVVTRQDRSDAELAQARHYPLRGDAGASAAARG